MKINIGVANQFGSNVPAKLAVLMADSHGIDKLLVQKFELNNLKTGGITVDDLTKALSHWLTEFEGDDVYISTSDIVVIELFQYAAKTEVVDDVSVEFWNLNDNSVNKVSCVNGRLLTWIHQYWMLLAIF